jgi:3-hydroxybutyrate dehydrogenase
MTDLSGKTALVTGSTSGIGLAVAEAMGAAGARVAVHGIAGDMEVHDALERVRKAGSPEAEYFAGDLRHPDRIAELMAAVAAWGGVDVLVNNAGIQHTAPTAEMPADKWDAILAINLSAAFHTMKAALPRMAERGFGRVINIASVHGLVASKDKAPYVAAKHGLVGMTRVVALEHAAAGSAETGGVTANCICPGWTETVLIEPQIQARAKAHGGDRAKGVADLLSEKQPSLRMSRPADIAALALWLCSPAAHNVTGTAIPIDGGWTAQ